MEIETFPSITPLTLSNHINLFPKIFSFESFDNNFISYLKENHKPSNNICAKILNNQGAFHCKECSLCENSVICIECYEKSKDIHKNHTISFDTVFDGCCDCGNPEALVYSAFCSSHKGTFSNDDEINNFIKLNFNNFIIEKISHWINELISFLEPYFLEMEKEDNIYDNNNLNNIMKDLTKFLYEIFNSNSALAQLFFQKFLKSYPFKTNHTCLITDENKGIEFKNYNNKEHNCECSFFKIFLSVWTDKIKCEDLLYSFLQNNRMKIEFGLTFIGMFNIVLNNNAIDLFDFSCQVYTSDSVTNLIKESYLIANMFKYFHEQIQKMIKQENQNWEFFFEKTKRFNFEINDLIKVKTLNLFSENIEMLENFINICEEFNNINQFEETEVFEREGFSLNLIYIEYYILDLFSLLISIFNFNNFEIIKRLFKYYQQKFENYQFLNSNCYSYHITLIRSFSIFLNRFCMIYSIKNYCDIYDILKNVIQLFPNYQNIFTIIIKETMKFFGFLLSIESNHFVYYGEDMKNYVDNYFDYFIFHQCDFNIIKFMLCLEENINFLSINNILQLCSVNNSSTKLINNFLSNLVNPNINFISDKDEDKNLNLNKKIFEYLNKFIKDHSSIFDLFEYSFKYLKELKVNEEMTEIIINKEKEAISNIIKEKIIRMSVSNENSYTFRYFINYIHLPIFEEKYNKKIFEEMSDKIIQINGQFKFCLKNQFFQNFDIDYILEPYSIINGERYITDFKKKEVSLLNYYFYEPFKNYQKLNYHCYYNFFYFNNNIQLLITLSINLISKKDFKVLSDFLLFYILKLIVNFLYIDKNLIPNELKMNKEDFYKEINYLLNNLLSSLKNEINSSDEDKNLIYKFMLKNISTYLNCEYKDIEENKDNNKIKKKKKKELKNKKKNLLEKYKKKFKAKNLEILNINKEDNNEKTENCILCHLPLIEKNEKSDIFGLIGVCVTDYFIKNSKKITIKEEFEKHNHNPNFTFNSFYNNEKELSTRIVSCNHKIHSECYNKLIIGVLSHSNIKQFSCPLCKKLGNLFIPSFNLYNNNSDSSKLLSGFKVSDFFNEELNLKESLDENIFIKPNEIENKTILINSIAFIEDFFDGKLISFINNQQNYIQTFNILVNEFSNFIIYYNIVKDKNTQINIWTNFILSLRILLKTKTLNFSIFVIEIYNLIKFLKTGKDNSQKISLAFFRHFIDQQLDKVLFLCLILFDLENPEKFLIELFSPYNVITSYIKKIFLENAFNLSPNILRESITHELFKNYILENDLDKDIYINLKESFQIFLEKIYIFSLINNNKKCNENFFNENKDIELIPVNIYQQLSLENFENKPFAEIILKLNENLPKEENETFKLLYKNKINNDKIIENIFEHFKFTFEKISMRIYMNQNMLSFGKRINFKFIPLEKSMIHFLTTIQKKSFNCGKEEKQFFYCLLCGEKLCDNTSCIPKEDNQNNDISYVYHSRICNYGNVAYIIGNGKVIFLYHGKIVYINNGIYLNQFGEEPLQYVITNDYLLVEKEYEKCQNIFIDFSYRSLQVSQYQ